MAVDTVNEGKLTVPERLDAWGDIRISRRGYSLIEARYSGPIDSLPTSQWLCKRSSQGFSYLVKEAGGHPVEGTTFRYFCLFTNHLLAELLLRFVAGVARFEAASR